MELIENIHVDIELQPLMRALGGGRIAMMEDGARWAIKIIRELTQPKAIADVFNIKSHGLDTITIATGTIPQTIVLHTGTKGAELLADACCVQISFVTLGDTLENLEDDLKKQKKLLKSYILDVASVLALEQAGRVVNHLAEQRAANKGWGVGRRISPGDLRDWTMEGQSALSELLPMQSIGINVNPSGMLTPLKSASSVIGMGPSYSDSKVGSICQWCRNQKTCLITMSRSVTGDITSPDSCPV